jgi:hypothetical protein
MFVIVRWWPSFIESIRPAMQRRYRARATADLVKTSLAEVLPEESFAVTECHMLGPWINHLKYVLDNSTMEAI